MHASAMYGSVGHIPGSGFAHTEASLPTMSYLNDNTYKDTNTLPYQNTQEVITGISPNYGYNSAPNDYERPGQGVRSDFNKSLVYGQATQQGPWASHYYTTALKSEREEEPGNLNYLQNSLYQ